MKVTLNFLIAFSLCLLSGVQLFAVPQTAEAQPESEITCGGVAGLGSGGTAL